MEQGQAMATEPTFEDHVRYLSSHLRDRYDMRVESSRDDVVYLKNDIVAVRFFAGEPRDSFVHANVSYADKSLLGPDRKSFEMWRYVDYCDARSLFPIRRPAEKSEGPLINHLGMNRTYAFIGSPLMLLEIMNFLQVHADPILRADREEVESLVAWIEERDREYNERMSR